MSLRRAGPALLLALAAGCEFSLDPLPPLLEGGGDGGAVVPRVDGAVAEDLSGNGRPPIDLAVAKPAPVDAARPVDLAAALDLAEAPDLTACGRCGQPCCPNGGACNQCPANQACAAGQCVPCGDCGQPCCPGERCRDGVLNGCLSLLVCESQKCAACGGKNQPCCAAGGARFCTSACAWQCVQGFCRGSC